MTSVPLLTFYLHPYFWPKGEIPPTADTDWAGFAFGPYIWTIQTCLRLQAAGVECRLTSEVPSEGILLAHRESLAAIDGHFPERVVPGRRLLVVDLSADLRPYVPANLHVVQNRRQAARHRDFHYVNHWPQPGIRPRDPERGDRLEQVTYLGNAKNLDPGFRSPEWLDGLRARGLTWIARPQTFRHREAASYAHSPEWGDYGTIDVLVAVRRFSPTGRALFDHKPASKLYNAWLAGVPAILGRESAFEDERRGPDDYLEANSVAEALAQLDRLRDEPGLRQRMVGNGFRRSTEIDAAATTRQWLELVERVIVPAHDAWVRMSPAAQAAWLIRKRSRMQWERFRARLRAGRAVAVAPQGVGSGRQHAARMPPDAA